MQESLGVWVCALVASERERGGAKEREGERKIEEEGEIERE